MEQYLELLEDTGLFQGITQTEIESMLSCLSAVKKSYQKGEYIFHIGERISSVALLLSGKIHIQKEDYWGNLSILSEISEGDLFGEVYACLGDEKMLYNAVAVKDSVVLFIDVHKILTVECLIHNLLTVIATKNKLLAQKLHHMSQRTTREKLLSYLSEQSVREGSSSFTIPFNRQQLADFLSVDRSAMSYELCKMRDEGMITFKKNHFVLHEKEKLV